MVIFSAFANFRHVNVTNPPCMGKQKGHVGGSMHKHKQYGCNIKKTRMQEETKWTKEKD
jgi:hypothetical protein